MLELKDLSPAVQKRIQNEAKGAGNKNIGKETEHGVAQYDVETMLNGKHRDLNLDTKGVLLGGGQHTMQVAVDVVPINV